MKKLINYFFAALLLSASLGAAAAKQTEGIKKKPGTGDGHLAATGIDEGIDEEDPTPQSL